MNEELGRMWLLLHDLLKCAAELHAFVLFMLLLFDHRLHSSLLLKIQDVSDIPVLIAYNYLTT
jgi:hypothetical protein